MCDWNPKVDKFMKRSVASWRKPVMKVKVKPKHVLTHNLVIRGWFIMMGTQSLEAILVHIEI